ncbi:hypothetical protein [uncultured Aquimarina sp.]|uniref:hypothetical protein n=1 Tax=uncultured Aquimarina sp. TaxID=575652 RepID=UPI00260CE4FA|nr:hypothetical protein [uncultured Aquimarina sp.]
MIKGIIKKILGRDLQQVIINQTKELEWAHIYHDSIRDKGWINSLSLNIGRWAGNYPFFYILNRILNDYKPKEILELGLGESSKFISTYLDNYLMESTHTIIEQDNNWKNNFNDRFTLSTRSSVHILPLQKKNINGFKFNGYEKIEEFITKKYDLYLVDGPLGSSYYSRYDIVNIVKKMNKNDEFILILDDVNRDGEKQTFNELKKLFKEKEIDIHIGQYGGMKSVAVIGTKKYRFVESL